MLRPGGELRFMEHVLAESAGRRRIQRLADATCWPTCFGGCHASRDSVAAISAAGFSVRELVHYRLPGHARAVADRPARSRHRRPQLSATGSCLLPAGPGIADPAAAVTTPGT